MFNIFKKEVKAHEKIDLVTWSQFDRFVNETYDYLWAIAKAAKVKPEALVKLIRSNAQANYASEVIQAFDKTLNMNELTPKAKTKTKSKKK